MAEQGSVHVIAACLNLTYNGVQFVPGHPDHFVFTDNDTGSTFLTEMLISIEDLELKACAVRAKFRSPEEVCVAWAY
jgi:hypothetical protein